MRLRIGGIAASVGLMLAAAALPAQASEPTDLHFDFPSNAEVTVVQGQSSTFTIELEGHGHTLCSATTAPQQTPTVFLVDALGRVAAGQPAGIPIVTVPHPKPSEPGHCDIQSRVFVPLTATAAAGTTPGEYTTFIPNPDKQPRTGPDAHKYDTALTIHVLPAPPPPQIIVQQLPAPQLVAPTIVYKPTPKLGQSVLLTRVKDTVYFTPPGGTRTYLGDPIVVPNGTLIEPIDGGVVKITVARDKTGALDSVDVWGTSFTVRQGPGAKPVTTLTLAGDDTGPQKVATAAAANHKRTLWANGKGNFKTRGKRASAIVRGTYWVTEETSAGTTVQVKTGLVAVRDFVRKTTSLVSAGHSYTARPRKATIRRIPAFTGSVR